MEGDVEGGKRCDMRRIEEYRVVRYADSPVMFSKHQHRRSRRVCVTSAMHLCYAFSEFAAGRASALADEVTGGTGVTWC